MKKESVGGLALCQIDMALTNTLIPLGKDPYEYYLALPQGKASLGIKHLNDFCIYIKDPSVDFSFRVNDVTVASSTAAILLSGSPLKISVEKGHATLFIAGLMDTASHVATSFVELKEEQIKRVAKPWGYELWITGESHKNFALKKIFIKAGTKTSLQYHEFKRETNLLFGGSAKLHYNPNEKIAAPDFLPGMVETKTIAPVCTVDVFPMKVHRLEAVSDILLFEVSTPHLNDVIRISDDSGRSDGRIAAEHG